MIAFCFLLYDSVQHPDRWEDFFNSLTEIGIEYTIYTHPKSITKKTQDWVEENAIETIPTAWGEYSLLEASLLLFEKALENRSNKVFILLSGAEIPMYSSSHFLKKIQTTRSQLDIKYNSEYKFYGASQWMYLSRKGAKDMVRLLDSKDEEAVEFLDYWIAETDMNGEDCNICEVNGADEVIPVNWFIHLYGKPSSKTFKREVKNKIVTYAYFKTPDTQSPKLWTSRNLTGYRQWEMCKCIFGRKYDDSAVRKLGWCENKKFTKKQRDGFKKRKQREPPQWWGQPTR